MVTKNIIAAQFGELAELSEQDLIVLSQLESGVHRHKADSVIAYEGCKSDGFFPASTRLGLLHAADGGRAASASGRFFNRANYGLTGVWC